MKNSGKKGYKKLKAIIYLMVAFVALWESQKGEAATDSEGYPIIYLRGTFGKDYWMPDASYRFKRTGTTYSLEIGEGNKLPSGAEFKIADEDWDFDFGGSEEGIIVEYPSIVVMTPKGRNLYTMGLREGTISFEYPKGESLKVKFGDATGEELTPSKVSGTLPVMYINVYTDESHTRLENEIIDYNLDHKEYFTEGEYWIDLNGCTWMEAEGGASIGSHEDPLPLQIKARGNWTRIGFSKKPFKLKLDKKQNLLGLTPEKNKHYALLPHADDTDGYLRTYTLFCLGQKAGLPWTPSMQPVELVINGDYRGLYFLTESVRVGKGRIDIAELEDYATDPTLISGGYIVELDNYDEENQIRMEEKSWVGGHLLDRLRITFESPEEYSDIQKRFVTDQFTAINQAVGKNDDILWSYLDLDDAVRYYMVREIAGDTESFHGSTYLYRDRGEGEKWHFSPLWDAGNTFRSHIDDYFYNCDPFGNTWIPSICQNNKFNSKLKATWLWFMSTRYPELQGELEAFANHISEATKYDRKRWMNEPVPGGGQVVADNSDMNQHLGSVEWYLAGRVKWLKGQWGDYGNGKYEEPERDTTKAAALPEYAQAGIEEIFDTEERGEIEYYNLQGLKIQNPVKGELYIIRKGTKSAKVIY